MIESVSRRAFSSSSGTYNVRASELARERKLNIFSVSIVFLDDTQHSFQIEKKAKGSVLLEQVFQNLELVEKDYFGLQFTENGSPPNATNTEITRWLDVDKCVKKQVNAAGQLWLGVRFYPPEPARLGEEFTRYLLCLQLRRLLLDGRLTAPKNTALLLASFTVQAELGDYGGAEEAEVYAAALQLGGAGSGSPEDERRVRELHRLHAGQSPADAEANFLEHARRLHQYGVESHPAKDYNGKDIFIGVTSTGIVVFQNSIRVNSFTWSKIVKISYKRKQFFIQIKREPSESYDTVLGFNMRSGRASKALWRCSVERHSFFRLRAPRRPTLLAALGALAGRAAPRVARTETQALADARRSRSSNRTFVRRSSSRQREMSPGKLSLGAGCTGGGAGLTVPAPHRGARVTVQDEPPPRAAWTDEPEPHALDEGGFLERALRVPLTYVDDSESAEEGGEGEVEGDAGAGAGVGEDEALVTARLAPGADGRFGFNVRGGGGAPVLVSRVAPATPAHTSRPQVQEGDQVMAINGMSVEEMSHDQVVQLIRNTRGVLTLTLRPNAVYEPEDSGLEEPAVCFVPLGACGAPGVAGAGGDDALEQSVLLLGDGLASGAALRQYETLLRRLPDEPCAHARRPHNLTKNRYRDIAPYDKTRVILQDSPSGDYINASYINMEIPSSDLVLTYIATQGPLASTIGDFWQMVWECESTLVVMLTVLAERGRAKCAQYWPRVGGPALWAHSLSVLTLHEQAMGHYVMREMLLKDSSGAQRSITQLQYTAWPDHGVPDDAAAFIRFTQLCSRLRTRRPVIPSVVEELETNRSGSGSGEEARQLEPPMVVHCSAGVGRTGALVLAETALELLRRRQPLYPLDMVRAMRTQRPMCIQTASQYKFVCESIQAAHSQGLARTTSESGSH